MALTACVAPSTPFLLGREEVGASEYGERTIGKLSQQSGTDFRFVVAARINVEVYQVQISGWDRPGKLADFAVG